MAAFLKDAAAGAAALGDGRAHTEEASSPRQGGAGDEAAGEKLGGLEEELRFLSSELDAVGRNMEQVHSRCLARDVHLQRLAAWLALCDTSQKPERTGAAKPSSASVALTDYSHDVSSGFLVHIPHFDSGKQRRLTKLEEPNHPETELESGRLPETSIHWNLLSVGFHHLPDA